MPPDRTNEIDRENYRDMQRVGNTAAFVPKELGGFGLQSIHDWTLTIATLARGDGSAAIAISMHLSATRGLAALYHRSEPGSALIQEPNKVLEAVARREMLICSTTTGAGHGQSLLFDGGDGLRGRLASQRYEELRHHVSAGDACRDQCADAERRRRLYRQRAYADGHGGRRNNSAIGMRSACGRRAVSPSSSTIV